MELDKEAVLDELNSKRFRHFLLCIKFHPNFLPMTISIARKQISAKSPPKQTEFRINWKSFAIKLPKRATFGEHPLNFDFRYWPSRSSSNRLIDWLINRFPSFSGIRGSRRPSRLPSRNRSITYWRKNLRHVCDFSICLRRTKKWIIECKFWAKLICSSKNLSKLSASRRRCQPRLPTKWMAKYSHSAPFVLEFTPEVSVGLGYWLMVQII